MSLTSLIPALQLAIGPAILISGVGLILLSMTNRFGRVIDRSRQLTHELRGTSGAEREKVLAEVRVLWLRARIVRAGIALAVLGALLAALLIISLFMGTLLMLGAAVPAGLFVMCMVCLIGAMLMFFCDINLSLKALRQEIPAEARGGAKIRGMRSHDQLVVGVGQLRVRTAAGDADARAQLGRCGFRAGTCEMVKDL